MGENKVLLTQMHRVTVTELVAEKRYRFCIASAVSEPQRTDPRRQAVVFLLELLTLLTDQNVYFGYGSRTYLACVCLEP